MKKAFFSVLTLCLALLGTMSSKANPVDAATARTVATNFLSQKSGHAVELVDVTSQMPYRHMYFFVEPNGNGNVILSADDRAIPVLGYSTNTTFDPADLPPHVDSWFRQYDNELEYIIVNELEASEEITDEWSRLIKGLPEPTERAREKSVSPLLTTQWGQGGPSGTLYNNLCPHSGSTYTYAGCTAVATAQIMKYWNHPTQGRGSHSYSHGTYGTLSANFGTTTYAWSSMSNSLSSSSTSAQKTAIATLLYHVGVACEMDYGINGSGASTVSYGLNYASAENALTNYFKYSSSAHTVSKSDFTSAEWIALLKSELDAATPRPILYSGYDTTAGHAFVLDGYDNSNKFHVNWGWTGRYDNYYVMGALNPGTGGAGGNTSGTYNFSNKAVIGIKPISNTGSNSTVTASVNNSSWGSVSGARSYSNYDTVSIIVNTNEGYRFKKWTDGSMANPREFIINDNMTLTAEIERISGDTLYHTLTYPSSYLGLASRGTYYWGVKFPTSALTASRRPTAVQFYARYTGTYTLYIYNDGANAPSGTAKLSGSLSLTSTNQLGYISASLGSSTFTIDPNKPLWVVLKYTNNSSNTIYCIPLADYGGNQYSKMKSSNGTSWSALSYSNSWPIRLITAYTSNPVGITEVEFADDYSITNGKGYITVTGVENETVRLIDNSGRVIATDNGSSDVKEFVAPASGVYLIQVGNKPARKVVVKK